MERDLLVSWLAVVNDFYENGDVDVQGPTIAMHAYQWIYEKHLMFYTPDYEAKAKKIRAYVEQNFYDHKMILVPIDIKGIFTNIAQIKSKVERVLIDYRHKKIDFSLSMGTGIMKIVWYMIHVSQKFNSRLTVILPPSHSEDPLNPDMIEIKVENSDTPFNALVRQKNLSRKTHRGKIFRTVSLQKVYDKAYKIALSDNISVIINGSTGTGKEVLARYIHKNSARKHKPFFSVNCSAFSDTLLESRLFGHTKGSFTGAISDKKGIFEQANGGTVFLDEIGDISPYMQQALLRFMQDKEIQPVGGNSKELMCELLPQPTRICICSLNKINFVLICCIEWA